MMNIKLRVLRLVSFITLMVMLFVGCAGSAGVAMEALHIDGEWFLASLYGDELPVAEGGQASSVSFTLKLDAERASGKGSCNSWGATITRGSKNLLHFSALWSTKMMCDDYGSEQRYFQALSACASFRLYGGSLWLLDDSGNEVARFRRAVD